MLSTPKLGGIRKRLNSRPIDRSYLTFEEIFKRNTFVIRFDILLI